MPGSSAAGSPAQPRPALFHLLPQLGPREGGQSHPVSQLGFGMSLPLCCLSLPTDGTGSSVPLQWDVAVGHKGQMWQYPPAPYREHFTGPCKQPSPATGLVQGCSSLDSASSPRFLSSQQNDGGRFPSSVVRPPSFSHAPCATVPRLHPCPLPATTQLLPAPAQAGSRGV